MSCFRSGSRSSQRWTSGQGRSAECRVTHAVGVLGLLLLPPRVACPIGGYRNASVSYRWLLYSAAVYVNVLRSRVMARRRGSVPSPWLQRNGVPEQASALHVSSRWLEQTNSPDTSATQAARSVPIHDGVGSVSSGPAQRGGSLRVPSSVIGPPDRSAKVQQRPGS